MKRQATGRPVISWGLINRNSEKTIEATLKSLRAITPDAEIVVVDTMSSDSSPEIAKRYADVFVEYKGPNGDWTKEMFAFDDAAAARNESFRLCKGKWIGWVDTDDELVPPAEAHRLLLANGYILPGTTDVPGEKKGELDTGDAKVAMLTLESYLDAVWGATERIEAFWAPYLYRFMDGEEGKAGKAEFGGWQMRERIVRVDENGSLPWKWHRKAHECLAPDDPALHQHMAHLATLLFVHRKEWTADDERYSIDRHYAIVRKDYDAGKRDFHDLYYLATYAPGKCPQDRPQLLEDYLAAAGTQTERARAHLKRGQFFLSEGYYNEAIEAFTAGVLQDPNFPDNYFALAQAYVQGKRWFKAGEAYAVGSSLPVTHMFSAVAPKQHLIVNRILGAIAYWRAWKDGHADRAALIHAQTLVEESARQPGATATDKQELNAWLHVFQNENRGMKQLLHLRETFDHLVANDETAKAARLAELIPNHMFDRPEAEAMRMLARKIHKHATDDKAYQQFYSEFGTDQANPEEKIYEMSHMGRIRFANHYLKLLRNALGRPLKILEVGSWDGITALNVMKELTDSHYTAIEANDGALKRLQERVEKQGWKDRFTGVQGMLTHDAMLKAKGRDGGFRFDAIIMFEVIEHIVDPTKALEELFWALSEKGRLFISTPWASFDRGFPEDLKKRDPRGHVHAYTPRALYETMTEHGFHVYEANGVWAPHSEGNFGDTQVLMAGIGLKDRAGVSSFDPRRSPTFLVPAALWDWNATTVEQTGMGASEETIVYLARQLGRLGGRPQVFGPIPLEHTLDACEVRDGVAYWPKSQLPSVHPDVPLVVSRAPSAGPQVQKLLKDIGCEPPSRMVLWLQDTWYSDLNVKTAAAYERIVCLSQWHREVLAGTTGIPLEKFKIIPNFILKEHFPDVPSKVLAAAQVKREVHRLIYCSSPDRGLLPLLRMWPEIRRRWPDATLGIYYGWEGAIRLASTNPEWVKAYRTLRTEYNRLRLQPGIEEVGRINHHAIANEMRRSSVWAYPVNDRASVETFCSNAVKARAAGCVPVTVPAAALKETAASALTQFVEWTPERMVAEDFGKPGLADFRKRFEIDFVDAIGRAFEATDDERDAMAKEAIETYELGRILPVWEQVLRG